jgi:hypothetical protein
MIIAIHQPNFLPWLGYFHKLATADAFVFLDDVQYSKNSFTNRNRIKTHAGIQWLTVPLRTSGRFGQTIGDVVTSPGTDWPRQHMNSFSSHYGKAAYFGETFALVRSGYLSARSETRLADFNISLIRAICDFLDLTPSFVRASTLNATGNSTQLLVNICRELKATSYIAGMGALKYQEDAQFEEAGIQVRHCSFQPPSYPQLWGSFVPGLSVIDALMNCGKGTRQILVS